MIVVDEALGALEVIVFDQVLGGLSVIVVDGALGALGVVGILYNPASEGKGMMWTHNQNTQCSQGSIDDTNRYGIVRAGGELKEVASYADLRDVAAGMWT